MERLRWRIVARVLSLVEVPPHRHTGLVRIEGGEFHASQLGKSHSLHEYSWIGVEVTPGRNWEALSPLISQYSGPLRCSEGSIE